MIVPEIDESAHSSSWNKGKSSTQLRGATNIEWVVDVKTQNLKDTQ